MRFNDTRGMVFPSESRPPVGSIAPIVTCASGCNSMNKPGAISTTMKPSSPVVTTAPSGNGSPTLDSALLETPSTTTAAVPSACRTVLA
jgi:hypothetical protein